MRVALIMKFLALTVGLAGCDLFRTREAEPPDAGRGTWETPRVPDEVLTNLRNAMAELNQGNYLLSFDEALFRFYADDAALAREPSLAGWDYAAEQSHVERLFPNAQRLSVRFTYADPTIVGDSAVIHAQYEITADVEISGVPQDLAGGAEFRMHMGQVGFWQVYYWKDVRTGELSTWSDLKSSVRR